MYLVKAAPNRVVPMESNFKRHITSAEIAQVEETAYYMRSISSGDLVLVSQAEWDAQEKKRIQAESATAKTALSNT